MKTFEISIDDSTYSNMLKEIKMLRLIDDIDISRSTFIECAIYEFCVHRFALRENIYEFCVHRFALREMIDERNLEE